MVYTTRILFKWLRGCSMNKRRAEHTRLTPGSHFQQIRKTPRHYRRRRRRSTLRFTHTQRVCLYKIYRKERTQSLVCLFLVQYFFPCALEWLGWNDDSIEWRFFFRSGWRKTPPIFCRVIRIAQSDTLFLFHFFSILNLQSRWMLMRRRGILSKDNNNTLLAFVSHCYFPQSV